MELSEKDIKSYNEMFNKWYGRDATLEEMYELKRNINMLLEMIYDCYVRDKKSGKLPDILKENKTKKII